MIRMADWDQSLRRIWSVVGHIEIGCHSTPLTKCCSVVY